MKCFRTFSNIDRRETFCYLKGSKSLQWTRVVVKSYKQHGKCIHNDSGTAKVPCCTWPSDSSAHQQIPISHWRASKFPFGKQCKVTIRPLASASYLFRLHVHFISSAFCHQSQPNIRFPDSEKQKHLRWCQRNFNNRFEESKNIDLPVSLSPRHCFIENVPSISHTGFHPTTPSKCIVCMHDAENESKKNRNYGKTS